MAKTDGLLQDALVRLSVFVCGLGLGGFFLWASFAPLEDGVVASGQLVVSGDRKEIAHFEGGVIRLIHVEEGKTVREGAPLVTLEAVQSESARAEIAQDLALNRLTVARLNALRSGRDDPDFPNDINQVSVSSVARLQDQQMRLFREQRASVAAERSVLLKRKSISEGQYRDIAAQIQAIGSSLKVARQERQRRGDALAERLETVSNVQQAEREVLALEAELARLTSEQNAAQRASVEADSMIAELEARFRRDIEEEAARASAKILALQQRLTATEDRVLRTEIIAPISGQVLGLEANTIGGVVLPGEPIMEIVPGADRLVGQLQLLPTDREAVRPGQFVEAQLSSYKQYRVPRINGEVLLVSADLKEDPVTGVSYYEVRVALDPDTLRGLPDVELWPGLPIEAFIASGRERTFLDRVLEPISSTIERGLRFN